MLRTANRYTAQALRTPKSPRSFAKTRRGGPKAAPILKRV
jgi:hypothetical protein